MSILNHLDWIPCQFLSIDYVESVSTAVSDTAYMALLDKTLRLLGKKKYTGVAEDDTVLDSSRCVETDEYILMLGSRGKTTQFHIFLELLPIEILGKLESTVRSFIESIGTRTQYQLAYLISIQFLPVGHGSSLYKGPFRRTDRNGVEESGTVEQLSQRQHRYPRFGRHGLWGPEQ
ncbi:hypothetical protein ES708_33220 [subsurface metagenome]